MQQTLYEDCIMPKQLVDLFDRFFSKTLSKENNYSSYSKEWDSFRELLSKDPLDLNVIFQQIASVQMKNSKQSLCWILISLDQQSKLPISFPKDPLQDANLNTLNLNTNNINSTIPSIGYDSPFTKFVSSSPIQIGTEAGNTNLKFDVPSYLSTNVQNSKNTETNSYNNQAINFPFQVNLNFFIIKLIRVIMEISTTQQLWRNPNLI